MVNDPRVGLVCLPLLAFFLCGLVTDWQDWRVLLGGTLVSIGASVIWYLSRFQAQLEGSIRRSLFFNPGGATVCLGLAVATTGPSVAEGSPPAFVRLLVGASVCGFLLCVGLAAYTVALSTWAREKWRLAVLGIALAAEIQAAAFMLFGPAGSHWRLWLGGSLLVWSVIAAVLWQRLNSVSKVPGDRKRTIQFLLHPCGSAFLVGVALLAADPEFGELSCSLQSPILSTAMLLVVVSVFASVLLGRLRKMHGKHE